MPPDDPVALADDTAVVVDAVERVVKTALAPVVGRLRALEAGAGDLAAARERIAALEARPPLPGPPGPPGPAGADGLPGADGRGMTYRGVHVDGAPYVRGDVVTREGSMWHCNTDTTTRPGDGGHGWTLAVKRGRDGSGRP
jgi:hypothetical protein